MLLQGFSCSCCYLTGDEKGQKWVPGLKDIMHKRSGGERKSTLVTRSRRVNDVCFVRPECHKPLKDSQSLRVLILGATCR